VLAQSYRDIEVIIVDDGSTDDTREVAGRLIRERGEGRVRLIRQENLGVSAARNNGIRASTGEFFVPLDADDALKPDYLERVLQAVGADKSVALTYTWTEHFGADTARERCGEFTHRNVILRSGPPCTALIRRSSWEKVGGYKDGMHAGGEDWEFTCSLYEAGFSAAVVPEYLLMYRKHGPSRSGGEYASALEVNTQVKLLHPALFEPFLCRISVRLAKAVIRLKSWTRDPITRYFYINFPRLHGFFRDIKYSGLK
jgi:glycosyltransferase involved in cell wall biosynthesis